jgi:hypothetical protein
LQTEVESLRAVVDKSNVLWSQKLNIISDQLPRGVWVKKVVFQDDTFMIQCSAIAKRNTELINVHKFTSNLKKDPEFLGNLTDLELSSIQRRKIGNVEIVDFLLTTRIK